MQNGAAKILVIGSLGTLGVPLVRSLRKAGHDVFQADLYHSDEPQFMRTDIREYRQVLRLFDTCRFDYVYHLAAEFGRNNGEEYYENLWTSNVVGFRHILEVQRLRDFKMIFASSSESYGNIDVDFMCEDLLNSRAVEHHNDYAITKYVNEKQALRFVKMFGNKILVCRFFNAYGPGEFYTPYRSVVCLFCYRLLHSLPITVFRDYHRVFMYIDDFMRTLSAIPDHFVSGEVVNIGGTEYRSVEELADLILNLTGRPRDLVKFVSREVANVTNKRPNIEKARAMFGHNPTVSLEQGVPDTLEWMRSIYKRD